MRPVARRIFIVAGEHSGDVLGAGLMRALRERSAAPLAFAGVGGPHMTAAGLDSLFPLSDIAVMGPAAILARLPGLARRLSQTVAAARDFAPDCLVIIDAPEFTHRVARRFRRRGPSVPIIDYVSPTVWAWRPGRARRMAAYVDHLLALLPFEPAAHAALGGPPCTYVGHPLIERRGWLDALQPEALAHRLGLAPGRPVVVALPGSRPGEVARLMRPFGEALVRAEAAFGPVEIILPVVESVRPLIEAGLGGWPRRPHFVSGDEDKFSAFRLARGALAASGTVTLELAFAGCPMVVAYRVDGLAAQLRFLVKVRSIVLANLVLDANAFPEFIQEQVTGETLAGALLPLLGNSPERAAQQAALGEIGARLAAAGSSPSQRAATVVLAMLQRSATGAGASRALPRR